VSASGSSTEKRNHPRTTRPKVVLRIPSVDRFREYYLKDISEGGIFIKAERPRSVGTELALELWPPGWKEPLILTAKVIRTVDAAQAAETNQAAGMAVAFLPAIPEIEQQLQWLLAEHQESEGSRGDAALADEAAGDLETDREILELQEALAAAKAELAEARGQVEAYADQAKLLESANASLLEHAKSLESLTADLNEQMASIESENSDLKEQLERLRETVEAQRRRASGLSAELEQAVDDDAQAHAVVPEGDEALAEEVEPALVEELPGEQEPKPSGLPELGLELNFDQEDLAGLTEASATPDEPDALDLVADPAADELIEEPPARRVPEPEDAELRELAAFNKALTFKTRLMPGGPLAGYRSEYEDETLLAELLGAAPTFATLLSQTEGKIEEDTLRLLLQRFQSKGLVGLRNP
jgi:hypothetical protein